MYKWKKGVCMKRHALLIGYSGWDIKGTEPLRGVSIDLQNYKNFLMSPNGGGWYENEITVLQDKSLLDIEVAILLSKREANDIVFTVFSGHGDYDDIENYCRRFEVSKNETILEKNLLGLSKKQILICDSCSGLRSKQILTESKNAVNNLTLDEQYLIPKAREKYEHLCLSCPEQTLRFYAAKVGSSAEDTSEGGRYSKTLLKILQNTPDEINIFQAHNLAAKKVYNESLGEQEPDYSVPKIHNFLPGAIAINKMIYT